MTQNWHPTIDTGRCKDDCLACVRFCPQKVYESDGKRPIIKEPDKCLEGCDSCKDICPENAISFLTTEMLEIDGMQVGINGMSEAFKRDDFESAFEEIKKNNYIPEGAVDKYKEALKKEFEKQHTAQ